MYKEITLVTTDGEKVFPMLANGATAIRYRQVFHTDLMGGLAKYGKMEENPNSVDWELPAKLAYIMVCAAQSKDMSKLSEPDFIRWVEQFEGDSFWQAQNEIVSIYAANQQTSSTAKNPPGPPTGK